jgi:hypothetical protein
MTAASLAKRLLIQVHRWVGIVIGLAAVVWFASGIAMIYVGGMPRLTPQARLDHLPVLDVSRVHFSAAQAAARLDGEGAGPAPGTPRLLMVQGRPAWRFAADRTIFADDGSLQAPLDEAAAAVVARQFLGTDAPGLRLAKRLQTADQWTLSMRRGPLLKYEVGDPEGTQLHVSLRAAEVVQATTRSDRTKAWIATIPHWLYFSALRQNQPLWYRVVVWLAALVCLLATLGLLLAFTQWRRTRPLDLKRAIPYRGGMRWHYITGSVFGVFALTWAFSGLLSMEPFDWTVVEELEVPRDALTGGAVQLSSYEGVDTAALPALVAPHFLKEIGFRRIHGEHYLTLRASAQEDEVLVEAATLKVRNVPFDSGVILARLRTALPNVPVVGQQLLQDYDDYYYSRNHEAPLPVLRVKLGDPLQTWLYVDPRSSDIVLNLHRYSRIERWLYNGLHSLDFRFWYSKRPLWDIAMITLLLGGLAASSIGVCYGVTRLVR